MQIESNLMNPYKGFISHGNDEKPDITAVQLDTKVSVLVLKSKEEGANDKYI